VSLLLTVLLALAVGSSVHAAERNVGERLLGFGDALSKIEGFSADPERRVLTVNGVELEIMTLTTREDIQAALGHLRALCRLGGISVPDDLLSQTGRVDPRLRDGIFEQQAEHEGVIACIDAGRTLELDGLVRGLERVRETGDLTALGALRFALARRSGDTTHVLVVWTRGSVEVAKMFPVSGDAPGFDPHGLPRPASSRRLLSAAEHDAPYGVTIYETQSRDPSAILREHRALLERAGWTTNSAPGRDSVVARRDGRAVVFVAGTLRNGRAFLSVADLARH
jgi:hypothetical protein